MAAISNAVPSTTGVTAGANFIREVWLDEAIVSQESNLVCATFFKRFNHVGKKGDLLK